MEMERMKKTLSCILCSVLIVAMALFTTGCNDNTGNQAAENATTVQTEAAGNTEAVTTETKATTAAAEQAETEATTAAAEQAETEVEAAEAGSTAIQVLGEGETRFMFTVVDAEGKETQFEIHTDKTTVGEALLDAGLIAGEDAAYGLYVKTVNGITLDYDADGKYWSFYINDQYAGTGVDSTEIKEGENYSFRAEEA